MLAHTQKNDRWRKCNTERPQAKLEGDKVFFVDDIMLVCDIQESNEDPYEFVCRRDPETLISTEVCANCPFMAGCFGLNLLGLEAETRRILEGDYEPS